MDFGTRFLAENCIEFNFWAPDSKIADLCVKNPDGQKFEIPLESQKDGWFNLITDRVESDAEYQFRLDSGMLVPDPASRYQSKDVHGASVLINPDEFDWGEDEKWQGHPWNEAVIYEIHTGSFTKEGTFKGIKDKLDYLVSLGITAIELMPVSDFPGKRNWGYDGVLIFAPDSTYGRPNELKDLIKSAHQKGLMVFLDVVYNHFGPEGNYLHVYAKSKFFNSKEKTPWGDSINFENRDVRDFFIQNALYWLEEYHFDGLRLDAVHAINDNSSVHILNEISQKVKERFNNRHVHLMLENDNNEAKYLKNNPGYTAQWNDDFHHAVHVLVTGEKSGYYADFSNEKSPHKPVYYLAKTLAEGFAYQGENSFYRGGVPRGEKTANLSATNFINFLQNHDQIGNRFYPQRISQIVSADVLRAAVCIHILSPSIPLVFMGEEFACEQPFYYFCDFEEELANCVKEGRLKEFSSFLEPAGRNVLTRIPDATSEEVFLDSKINWDKPLAASQKEILDYYKNMLDVRKKIIVPLIQELDFSRTEFRIINDSVFFVKWTTGNDKCLKLIANLSNQEYCCDSNIEQHLALAQNDNSVLIAESVVNGFQKGQEIIKNWGVYWFLDENNQKSTAG